ncbi:hypothetical protein BG004_008277 [Podila humilis]|nr:hypothetical protein BG004_008277 [Podila humilis]
MAMDYIQQQQQQQHRHHQHYKHTHSHSTVGSNLPFSTHLPSPPHHPQDYNASSALTMASSSPFYATTTTSNSSNPSSGTTKTTPVLHPITTNTSATEHHAKTTMTIAQHPPRQQHSLPSPPLSSVHPTANSGFFSKSPVHERCEALEAELSTLRARLKRSERSSTIREKRLSIFQQQSTDVQLAMSNLRQQHEITLTQLRDAQREMAQAKSQLQSQDGLIQRLEAQTHDQENQLKEVLLDRDSLSMEMMECHSDNAKFLKRLRTSSDKVEKLQLENRHLIDQLRELRAKVVTVSDEKLELTQVLDREKHRGSQAALGLEQVVARYKAEVEKLQDLVLMMGNRHVQVQAQLQFLQQQAQQHFRHSQQYQQQQHLHRDSSSASSSLAFHEHKALVLSTKSVPTTMTASDSAAATTTKHGSLMLGDGAIASILASVDATSHSRRSKPTRRFTVNASHQEAPLTLEQRKCEFLMDQITVLQRGYDTLRQEKVTLELQVDLMQRQHQYHQQQRQKRRESQRRTLGHEQSTVLSSALASMNGGGGGMMIHAPTGSVPPFPATPTSTPTTTMAMTLPSTPLSVLTRIPSSEELKQAQIRAQQEIEAQEKERAKQAAELKAKAAAEEAERQEAIRMKKLKDIHLKEALASLESKRGRSDSRNVMFTTTEELKHLEHLRLAHEDEHGPLMAAASPVNSTFQSAVNARASRRIPSPPKEAAHSSGPLSFSSSSSAVAAVSRSPSTSPSPLSMSMSSSSFFSGMSPSSSSPLSTAPTPASSFSSLAPQIKPEQHHQQNKQEQTFKQYTQQQHQQQQQTHVPVPVQHRVFSHTQLDIQQCSCCIGNMIDI